MFVGTLLMLLNSLYESASTIPRAETKLRWMNTIDTIDTIDTINTIDKSGLLKVYMSYIILNYTYYYTT